MAVDMKEVEKVVLMLEVKVVEVEELSTVRVFAALGAAGLPELYSTFMLLVWPSLVEVEEE